MSATASPSVPTRNFTEQRPARSLRLPLTHSRWSELAGVLFARANSRLFAAVAQPPSPRVLRAAPLCCAERHSSAHAAADRQRPPYPPPPQPPPKASGGRPLARRLRGPKSIEAARREAGVVLAQVQRLEAAGQRRMHHVLRKYAKSFGPESVLLALQALVERQDAERALEAFEIIRRAHWFRPDPQQFASLISLLCRRGQLASAARLFESMAGGALPPLVPADIGVALGEEEGEGEEGEEWEGQWEAGGSRLGRSQRSRGQRPATPAAKKQRPLPVLRPCPRTPAVYAALMEGLGRAGQVAAVLRLLRRMKAGREERCSPDTAAYTAAVRALCSAGRLADAEALRREMRLLPEAVAPSAALFTALLRGYGRAGRVAELKQCFAEMLAEGCRPDGPAFTALLQGLGRAGLLAEMEAAFESMQARHGVAPSVPAYLALLEAYAAHAQPGRAHRTLASMRRLRYRVGPEAFHLVFRAHAQAGPSWSPPMEALLALMRKLRLPPDPATLRLLAACLVRSRQPHRVAPLLRQARAAGSTAAPLLELTREAVAGVVEGLRQEGAGAEHRRADAVRAVEACVAQLKQQQKGKGGDEAKEVTQCAKQDGPEGAVQNERGDSKGPAGSREPLFPGFYETLRVLKMHGDSDLLSSVMTLIAEVGEPADVQHAVQWVAQEGNVPSNSKSSVKGLTTAAMMVLEKSRASHGLWTEHRLLKGEAILP